MAKQLPPIERAIASVKEKPRGKERTAEVNRILGSTLTLEELEQPEFKELLHRRALFVTELQRRSVWP